MFQSSEDDVDFDEALLTDVFKVEECENTKRHLETLNEQPVKKICTSAASNEITRNPECGLPKYLCPNIFKSPKRKHRIVQRKFPGPAGILSSTNKTLAVDEIVCSQTTEDVFQKGPWLQMLSDVSEKLYNKYTIAWTKLCALSNKLIDQRTPFLTAVVQSINCSSKNPMVVLRDRTGDIRATLVYEAWEEYQELLHVGSVIVLQQVGVLSISKRSYKRFHLTVTLNNLITIYSQNDLSVEVQIVKLQELSSLDIIQLIEKRKAQTTKKLPPNTNNPWFITTPLTKPLLRTPNPEDEILSQVLDGLDADSLFDEF